MKYELVSGDDIKKDVAFITEKMNADDDMVFVYTGKIPLYTYIEELDKAGKLSDEIQFRLKICYEKTQFQCWTLRPAEGSDRIGHRSHP